MTDTEPWPGAMTDLRRSLSLMAHYARADLDGIAAIATEAHDDEREDAEFTLLLALADFAWTYSPAMRRPDISDHLAKLAAACMVNEEQA